MYLNLHIIASDLKEYQIKTRLISDHLDRNLKSVTLFDPDAILRPSELCVLHAEDLDKVVLRRAGKDANVIYSLFILGKVNPDLLPKGCDAAWTETDESYATVTNRISGLFARYQEWHLAMEKATVRNKPLRFLGVLAQDFLPFPMWVYDRQYQTLFHVVDKRRYSLPNGYIIHEDQTPWPAFEIDAWHDGVKSGLIDIDVIKDSKRPYVLPAVSICPYSALCSNIYVGEGFEATVSIDDVGQGFTKRDESVLDFFAMILSAAVRRDLATNTSITYALDQKLKRLLDNEPITHAEIRNAINTVGWEMHDPYVCVVAVPTNPFYGTGSLIQVGEKVCKQVSSVIYEVVGRSVVFLCNGKDTRDYSTVEDLASKLHRALSERSCRTQLGVSAVYTNFADTFFFYRQGVKVLEWGRKTLLEEQTPAVFYYDDYITHAILANITDHGTPEMICPTGLACLIRYDREHSGDLIPILYAYLNNNMQVSETSRQLFVHRNTLINKVKKINEILSIDLNDADRRLEIMLALRLMAFSKVIDVMPEGINL